MSQMTNDMTNDMADDDMTDDDMTSGTVSHPVDDDAAEIVTAAVIELTGADDPAVAAYANAIEAVMQFSDRQDALDAALDRCAGFAVGHAYAAFIAGLLGQDGRAKHRADAAKSAGRSVNRRERQLIEILVLSSSGGRQRAAGLAAEHILEFADDASALDAIVQWFDARNR
jgi:hypothetical protein